MDKWEDAEAVYRKWATAQKQPPKGLRRVWSGLPLAHIVDIHVVGFVAKTALGYVGSFGHAACLDFVGLHFVVEVLYIDLEQTEGGAAPLAGVGCFV